MVRRATSRRSHRKIRDCEQSMPKRSSLIGEEGSAGNNNVKPTTNNNFSIKITKPNDNLTGASQHYLVRYSLSLLYDTDLKLGFNASVNSSCAHQ